MPPPAPHALRKVQPFLLPKALADALEETARSMASPMMPRVSLAAAARELIDKGLASLDALLRSGRTIVWEAVDPPRGARRREESATPKNARVRDDTYVQVSPLALSEDIIRGVEDVRRRLSATTNKKVSTVKVLRESLARGLAAREHARVGVEALLQKYAREFGQLGLRTPAQVTAVASGATQRYVASDEANTWGKPVRAGGVRPRAASAPKPAATATPTRRPRARGHRQQAAVRREPSGAGDGDDDPAPRVVLRLPVAMGGGRE